MNKNGYDKLRNLVKDHASKRLEKLLPPDLPTTKELLKDIFEAKKKGYWWHSNKNKNKKILIKKPDSSTREWQLSGVNTEYILQLAAYHRLRSLLEPNGDWVQLEYERIGKEILQEKMHYS